MSNFDIQQVTENITSLPPIKGFTEVDMMKKEIARDLAMAKKSQARAEPMVLKEIRRKKREDKENAGDLKHQDVRSFHNSVKRGLYQKAYAEADLENSRDPRTKRWKYRKTLLELACGRGGDLHKWKSAGYRVVVAVDKDLTAIDEAKRRVRGVENGVRADFGYMDLAEASQNGDVASKLTEMYPRSPWVYDTVSIQFAIQYLCKEDKILYGFLDQVADLVRPGGTFVGTFPDGSEIVKLLGAEGKFDNGFLKIEERVGGDSAGISFHADFGKGGGGGGSSYFDSFGTSVEYPVFWKRIRDYMLRKGFVLLEHKGFLEYNAAGDYALLPEEQDFSGVFKSFLFRKHEKTAYFCGGGVDRPLINWDSLQIDEVGKYSITRPRELKRLHQIILREYLKLSGGVVPESICDGTACVGGDTIGFSGIARQVYAWEVNEERYNMLVNNLNVYNIRNVEAYNQSFIRSTGGCDILYIDPPWGGPSYHESQKIELYIDGINLKDLLDNPRINGRFKMVAVKIPYNYNIGEGEQVYKVSDKIWIWIRLPRS
tara:strand:+ start:207 stop:1835 length:1629 start_codon:yes stop_codon:yes gene_type:complete